MNKAIGMIFSLLDVASALQVPLAYCSTYNVFIMDLSVSFVSDFFLLTVQGVDLWQHMMANTCRVDYPTSVMETVCSFCNDWIDYRGTLHIVLYLYITV